MKLTDHTVDEEMENVSQSSSGLGIDSERDCQTLKTPSCTKNGADTNDDMACPDITNSSVDKNVISLEPENHVNDNSNQSLLEDNAENNDMPRLGKEYESEEHAYKSYKEYADLEGFTIRKDFVNKNYDGEVSSRRYTCSREGHRRLKHGSNPNKLREDKRTGCLAHMTISRQRNGKYRVLHFEANHNHELGNLVDDVVPYENSITCPQNDSNNKIDSLIEKPPELGMKFDSEDHAYAYYSAYAVQAGFSIRKDYVNRRKDGVVSSRKFTCYREGFKNHGKSESNAKRPRKDTRIGCLAQMIIVRRLDRKYHVSHYEGKHNHDLVPSCRIAMLRSQKKGTTVQSVEELALGNGENTSYNPVDSASALPGKRKRDMKEGESEGILQYFRNKKGKDPSLFYAVQNDAEGQMANVFWADVNMVEDYHYFGDVVCLDTTYKLDRDCRPFISFTGVNHHKQMLIFGAALLYDDTFESFEWLLRTFLKVMSHKKPKTILTDQNTVLAEAINSLLPDTHHRLCAWHMYQRVLASISQEALDSDSFPNDLKNCFFNLEEEEDFVKAWETLLQCFNLWQNEVLSDIFGDRENWAMPYGRHMLCADIKFAQLSETFLPKVRKYLKSTLNISLCLKQFAKLLTDWRYTEVQANYDMSDQLPKLIGDVIMLKRVRDLYTPKIFELFQQEYEISLDFVIEKVNENAPFVKFKVSTYGQGRDYKVAFNSSEDSVACSCMKFQFEGILCSHAIKVLDYRNIKVVPTRYILKRWTRTARI